MKISEFEEILKAAREAHGDREIYLMEHGHGGPDYSAPSLRKHYLDKNDEENYILIVG